jgi:virginiamycin B lyase
MLNKRLLSAAVAVLGVVALPAAGQDLPDGPGKDLVAGMCSGCHDVNRVRAGYTPEGWNSVIQMMQNQMPQVTGDEWQVMTGYLVRNFPERPRPAGRDIPGPAQASIKLWNVPTPGSRPHDPAAARDGSIWWTGQLSDRIGRLDPKTGATREYVMPTKHTAPHGLMEDKDGNIWFTGNGAGLIGKLDPKTGGVTEYKLPDPEVRDPHTLIFDHRGILWFTAQQANTVGRLDPKTGEIKLVTSPTPRSRPYGMAVNSKGTVFFVEFGTNKIASIDDSMKIREWTLPDANARPRRIAIGPDDIIWYTDFSRGYLGRLDPATGQGKEWLSPAGEKSSPYGIVFTKGALWYNESSAKPNTIVRFDPQSEKFQSWIIPGGGDIVRNMDVTPDGHPIMANSLVNQIGLVEIK